MGAGHHPSAHRHDRSAEWRTLCRHPTRGMSGWPQGTLLQAHAVKIRPLGWELTTALVATVALSVCAALGLSNVAGAVLMAIAVVTPIVLISAGIRLIAGIVDEDRRYRRAKFLRP